MISLLPIKSVTSQFSHWTARIRSTLSHCLLKLMVKHTRCSEWKTSNTNFHGPKIRQSQVTERFVCTTRNSSQATAKPNEQVKHLKCLLWPPFRSDTAPVTDRIFWSVLSLSFFADHFSSLILLSKTEWSWWTKPREHRKNNIIH